jgi:putative acetyltransferase
MVGQVTLRDETPNDRDAVWQVNQQAFSRDDEARLVDELRLGGYVRVSKVAEENGLLVGHVLFSDLPIVGAAGTVHALALAPLAVIPSCQNRTIGSRLVELGLSACRAAGFSIVVVLGHPEFYHRFGFEARLAQRLKSPFAGPEFMALELVEGALNGVEGVVTYPPPFGGF